MSSQSNEDKPLGSFLAWVIFRLFIPLGFVPVPLMYGSTFVGLVGVIVLFAIPNCSKLNYAHAYGHANEEGIMFRRFIRQHFVTWDDVARVEWSNSNLLQGQYVIVTLERPVGLFRTVKFMALDKNRRLGEPPREDWVPEILPWMMNQMRMAQPPEATHAEWR